jgi:PAS domain S-box-containing protein
MHPADPQHPSARDTHRHAAGDRPARGRGSRADRAAREDEAPFATVADAAPVLIWTSGTDRRCTFFNKPWLDFTGRRLEQELGDGWIEGVHPDDVEACLTEYVKAFDAREPLELHYRLRRYDGEYRWIRDVGVPRYDKDGIFSGYVGSCVDMTDRKRAEDALEEQRAFLRQVIDINPNLIFAKDREGRFTLVNQAVAALFATRVEDMIGKTDADLNPHADEVASFRRIDLEVIETREERFITEERITDATGAVRYLQTVKRPIVDADGVARQVLGASTDITERRRAELELRRQQEELAHVARVSTMGELASSLAHELNQPLAAIMANAQAAQRSLARNAAGTDELREILADIVEDSRRAAGVIQRTRSLMKRETPAFTALDLDAVIRDVVTLVHGAAVRHHVSIVIDVAPGLPLVRGDRIQVQQVMLNLLLNAFDSMAQCPPWDRQVAIRTARCDERTVSVTCADRGTGVGPDLLDGNFPAFSTTKREGLGVGLSISQSIVKAHGGRLWAENNPDRGASFSFTLPALPHAGDPDPHA